MIRKEFSPLKSYSKSVFLIPAFGVLAFLFCTNSNPHDLILFNNQDENDLYADVSLGYKLPTENKAGDLHYYTLDGQLFTGEATYYKRENDQLYSKQLFEDGLMVGAIQYDKEGNQAYRVEHVFVDGVRAGFRHYGANDQILRDWVGTPKPGDSLTVMREWHPNGQLKFEMTSYSEEDRPMVYEGLMTLYDEQGNILQQELYEDGELIEKIK